VANPITHHFEPENIMKPMLLIPFSIMAIGFMAGTALAGPDWQTIERARAMHQAKPPHGDVAKGCGQAQHVHGPRSGYGPVACSPSGAESKEAIAADVTSAMH
jgi:hypothetical protein